MYKPLSYESIRAYITYMYHEFSLNLIHRRKIKKTSKIFKLNVYFLLVPTCVNYRYLICPVTIFSGKFQIKSVWMLKAFIKIRLVFSPDWFMTETFCVLQLELIVSCCCWVTQNMCFWRHCFDQQHFLHSLRSVAQSV